MGLLFAINGNDNSTNLTINGSGSITTDSYINKFWSTYAHLNQIYNIGNYLTSFGPDYKIYSLSGFLSLTDGNNTHLIDEIFLDYDSNYSNSDDFGIGFTQNTTLAANTTYTLSGSATFNLRSNDTFSSSNFNFGTYSEYASLTGVWSDFTGLEPLIQLQIGEDNVLPYLISSNPANNITSVATNSNIVLNFSEKISIGSGNIIIYKASDNSVFNTIDVKSSNVKISASKQVTINLDNDLEEQTPYYVNIAETAFVDNSGNSYAGISDTTTLSFTTADETNPSLSSSSPADNSTAVKTTINIVLNFSEAVNVKTGNIVIYKASDDSVVETIDVTSGQVTGTGTTQIIINPSSDLADSTSYYVQIAATAFDDSSSNSYAGMTDKTSLSFKTLSDTTSPTISGPSGSAGEAESFKSIDENLTEVYTFTSNESVSWSLNGGADASLFSINKSTGTLSFSAAPDYESPEDNNVDNDYIVVVRAIDSANNKSDQIITISINDVMDKENGSKSFYHLRNWENYLSNSWAYIDYSEQINWIYENVESSKVRWTVWDGGFDGYNYVSRQPFFDNELVFQYDATNYEVNFIQNLFNELDEYIELDFEQVTWGDQAHIVIWLVDQIPNFNAHGIGLFHGVQDYGTVAALIDVTNEMGINYTDYLIAHEIGHSLGLSHPGINGQHYPEWDLYTSQDTIMSYNSDEKGFYGTSFTDLDIQALRSIWGSEGSYGGESFDINKNSPVISKQIISSHSIGLEYELLGITDYDGNLHANTASVSADLKTSYKYQGNLDVNNDGVLDAIYTNKVSGRWAAGKIDSSTGEIDYEDHGSGGGTRVVGIYDDPLIAVGLANGGFLDDGVTPAPAQFGATGSDRYTDLNGDGDFDDDNEDRLNLNSQVRFQNDLLNDNLTVKASGDYDGDGYQEVYWKTNNADIYLRSLMHADGNIQYANYQNQNQMSDYLTNNGYASVVSDII